MAYLPVCKKALIAIVPLRIDDSSTYNVLQGRFEIGRIARFQHYYTPFAGRDDLVVKSREKSSKRGNIRSDGQKGGRYTAPVTVIVRSRSTDRLVR
jgi:hypothetical protein